MQHDLVITIGVDRYFSLLCVDAYAWKQMWFFCPNIFIVWTWMPVSASSEVWEQDLCYGVNVELRVRPQSSSSTDTKCTVAIHSRSDETLHALLSA